MRVAFYGRVSTDDAQDPSLSIPRQLSKCDQALEPIDEKVSLTFWDVESGRKTLEERGNGKRDWTAEVSVPRLGGLPELLASVQAGAVDAVIVESIDRVARMTADATRIERELEQCDVALFAADEPLNSSATAILTRRVKQGVAEWYVRDLIERSRAGMEESVRQGWHTGGRPPYGYVLEPHPHPNPQKAKEGRKKHRLILDPVRAPIVAMVFADYTEHGLGLAAICEKLNLDPEHYRRRSATARTRTTSAKPGASPRFISCSATPSTPATTSGGVTTNGRVALCCAHATNGCGAQRPPTMPSSLASSSTQSKIAPATTVRRQSTPRLPSTTQSDGLRGAEGSIPCAAVFGAASAAGAWKAAFRKARTTTAASTPRGMAKPPPTSRDTRAP
jgi:DNA invertase Pin-like site-specific DNA recombinase